MIATLHSILHKMIRIVAWLVAIIIGAIFLFAIVIPLLLKAAGYQLEPGWKVAEIAFERRDVSICENIIAYDLLLGPPTEVQKAVCIRKYASLAQDPTVCELLLPSEYGLACISNLWLQATPGEGCGWNYKDTTIFECRHGNDELLLQSKDCKAFKGNTKQFSRCIAYFAQRNNDIEQCKEVPDSFIRSLCEVRIGAWLKYPQLRNSFYFGTLSPLEN